MEKYVLTFTYRNQFVYVCKGAYHFFFLEAIRTLFFIPRVRSSSKVDLVLTGMEGHKNILMTLACDMIM